VLNTQGRTKGQAVEKLKELEFGTLCTAIRDTMQEDVGKHRNGRKPADLRDTESAHSSGEGSDKRGLQNVRDKDYL
jgi:hypothetical protein